MLHILKTNVSIHLKYLRIQALFNACIKDFKASALRIKIGSQFFCLQIILQKWLILIKF